MMAGSGAEPGTDFQCRLNGPYLGTCLRRYPPILARYVSIA